MSLIIDGGNPGDSESHELNPFLDEDFIDPQKVFKKEVSEILRTAFKNHGCTGGSLAPCVLLDADLIAYKVASIHENQMYGIANFVGSDDPLWVEPAADGPGYFYTADGDGGPDEAIPCVFEQVAKAPEFCHIKTKYKKDAIKIVNELRRQQKIEPVSTQEEKDSAVIIVKDPSDKKTVKDSLHQEMIRVLSPVYGTKGVPSKGRYLAFLTESEEGQNFRNSYIPDYKKSRLKKDKPFHLKYVKSLLKSRYGAVSVPRVEADDLLNITALFLEESFTTSVDGMLEVFLKYFPNGRLSEGCTLFKMLSYLKVGKEKYNRNMVPIVASFDKDLLQKSGVHLNFQKDLKLRHVPKDEAEFLLYVQCLTGDKTDDIPGLNGIGPVKAKNFLIGKEGEEALILECIKVYSDYYLVGTEEPDTTYDKVLAMMLNSLKCLGLCTTLAMPWCLTQGQIIALNDYRVARGE